MNYLLGQPFHMTRKENNVGIVTSFTMSGLPYGSFIKGGKINEEFFMAEEMRPIRLPDKNTPTGYSIYYGKHCKRVKANDKVKLKVAAERLKEVIQETEKLIKEKEEK